METIAHPSETKAIKEHNCDFCSEKISVGSIYIKSIHKMDGRIYSFKTHTYCARLAETLKMYDHADEGVTGEIFMETVSEVHYDLIIKQFPAGEIGKYTDILQQLRYVKWHYKLGYVIRHYAKIEREQEQTKLSLKL